MSTLSKSLAIAVTAVTIGLGMAATTTSASAFAPHHGMEFRHARFHHWGGHWGRHFHSHWHVRYHWHYRYAHSHCWSHRWCGPRIGYHFHHVHDRVRVVETGTVLPRCPPGMHLGYEGKYCWPNR